MDSSDDATEGQATSDSSRALWWTIAGCLVVVIGAPLVVRSRPAPVGAIAGWGSAIASIGGVLAGVARIILTRGKPFGDRDPVRDVTSPYLRLSLRTGFVLTAGLIAGATLGIGFMAYWYPRPDPHLIGTGPGDSPEEYALPPLFLFLILLAMGVYGITLQLYWARVVRRIRRALESPTGTS